MNEVMNIYGTDVDIKEYSDQRVVTFADIDKVHRRPDGTAKRNFNKNKNHFIKNVDYITVSSDEIRTTNAFSISDRDHKDKHLITETGYLMLVKSFRDDLAWKVQRMLVSTYFKKKEENQKTLSIEDAFRMVELINQTPNDRLPIAKAILASAGVDVSVEGATPTEEEYHPFHATPRGRLKYSKKYADMNGVSDFLKTNDPVNRPSADVYDEYVGWCKEQDVEPTSKIMFSKVVNQYLGTMISLMKIKGQVKRVFVEGGE